MTPERAITILILVVVVIVLLVFLLNVVDDADAALAVIQGH